MNSQQTLLAMVFIVENILCIVHSFCQKKTPMFVLGVFQILTLILLFVLISNYTNSHGNTRMGNGFLMVLTYALIHFLCFFNVIAMLLNTPPKILSWEAIVHYHPLLLFVPITLAIVYLFSNS